jgi:murein DD-endopeptidase MepM/ murein hydrolase activator NlpD
MSRRLLIVLAVALVLAAPAAGDDLHRQKSRVDARIAHLNDHVQSIRQRESALRAQIAGVSTRIRTLEAQVGDVALQLETLQQDLSLHERRLELLNTLYEQRTEKLGFLRRQYTASVDRLNQRLVDIYESDQTDVIGVVLSAGNFQDMLDQVDYVSQIGDQDRRIARQVRSSRDEVHAERERTKRARSSVLSETQAIAVRTEQKRLVKEQLQSTQSTLATARDRKKVSLDSLSSQERAEAEEIDALQAESATLGAKIQAAQSAAQQSGTSPAPSASPGGMQWPVSGPVTSPFGWRWGRMHEGIDIAVPSGTPVHAAAAGTVIYAGWMGGYGNLVAIDHGGGISTAYGHNTSVAVAVGQSVTQGQVIAYSGSTGHSTGPHVHFEVRVDGSPRDPLGYL